MTEFLAIITFTFCAVEDPNQCYQRTYPRAVECAKIGDFVTDLAATEGLLTDYRCRYTSAPATSMRPRARPIEI